MKILISKEFPKQLTSCHDSVAANSVLMIHQKKKKKKNSVLMYIFLMRNIMSTIFSQQILSDRLLLVG